MPEDKRPFPEKTRERIQAGMILDRLHKHITGEVELSATQIQAARILLAKALPDLTATEWRDVTESKAARKMTESELDAEIARRLAAAAVGEEAANAGEEIGNSLH